jgi:hypothetical protein
MYARLPMAVRDFAVFQVALSNGSGETWKIAPSDFFFETTDGRQTRGVAENVVIDDLFRNATEGDVIKLQSAYEKALYGNQHIRSSNGYEQRRQYAMAMGSKGLKAAAAASAITFVAAKLAPGDSTDGAVFFPRYDKQLGPGKLRVRLSGVTLEFQPDEPLTDASR